MPAQPAWFHRLDSILTALREMNPPYLDRQAIEKLFRVRQRRARQIVAGLPALLVGNAVAVERQALIARLEAIGTGDPYRWEVARRRRLAEELERTSRDLAARRVRIQAGSAAREARVGSLPGGIALGPGELRVGFTDAHDLAAKLYAVAQAMANDWPGFARAVEEAEPPRDL